jgi:hypothetical protein
VSWINAVLDALRLVGLRVENPGERSTGSVAFESPGDRTLAGIRCRGVSGSPTSRWHPGLMSAAMRRRKQPLSCGLLLPSVPSVTWNQVTAWR